MYSYEENPLVTLVKVVSRRDRDVVLVCDRLKDTQNRMDSVHDGRNMKKSPQNRETPEKVYVCVYIIPLYIYLFESLNNHTPMSIIR